MFSNKYNLSFGTDPEFFIVEEKEGKEWGIPVPHFIENLGFPEIGFDETRKHPVIAKESNFKIIMDGIAAEINNVGPHNNAKDFHNAIQDSIAWLDNFASTFGYKVSTKPTVFYDFFKYYRAGNKALEWCGIFGCDADKDAIEENYNSPEIDVTTHQERYGGGHLHISDNNRLIRDLPLPYIRLLAMFCGNYSILNSPFPELEKARMFKYGQPGRFRVQNYPDGNIGVEYRSPSNIWTTDLSVIEGMFEMAEKAYWYLNNKDEAVKILENYLSLTAEAIREVNKEKAEYILSKI
jgi:hypothetical protein